MKLRNNKKGNVGKQWLFAITFLFFLTFIFIIFNNVYGGHLVPLFSNLSAGDTSAVNGINDYNTKYKYVFYILYFIDVLYMFMLLLRRETNVERFRQ